MADQVQDSQGQGAGGTTGGSPPAPPPAGPVSSAAPSDSGTSDATVPRSEHETALAAERRRRSGQERAHQKEIQSLRDELTDIRARLANLPDSPTSADNTARLKALAAQLDNGGPVSAEVIREVVTAVESWASYLSRQQQEEARRKTNAVAVEDALDELSDLYPGVNIPRSALDTSTPDTIRMSAERYMARKEIEDLKREVADLRTGKSNAEQEAEMAATRTRTELGANRTVTSIGGQPVTPSALQEELAEVEQQIARAKRLRHGPEAMALERRRDQLHQEMAGSRA